MKYNRESHCTTQKEMKVRPHVDLFDIKNPRLQHIYNKELDDLEKSFADIKMQVDVSVYQREAVLCIWFSIFKENLPESQLMYHIDPRCAQIIKKLRTDGKETLQKRVDERNEQKKKRDLMFSMLSISGSQDVSGMN
jgi:hypothetical protein